MQSQQVELTLEQIQEQLKSLSADQLKELREIASEERKQKLEEERLSRPKPQKSHYRCENCDCGGLTAMAGLSFKCLQHEKNPTKAPVCAAVRTWEMTGRKKVLESQSTEEVPEEDRQEDFDSSEVA